jgi:cytochrome c oxidase subunit 3
MFAGAPLVFAVGTVGVLYTMAMLVARRHQGGQHKGDHTRVVQLHPALRHDPSSSPPR